MVLQTKKFKRPNLSTFFLKMNANIVPKVLAIDVHSLADQYLIMFFYKALGLKC